MNTQATDTLTVRVVGVPFAFGAKHKHAEHISQAFPSVLGHPGFLPGTFAVVTSPDPRCSIKVASHFSDASHLSGPLTLPGTGSKTDTYGRLPWKKLLRAHPELATWPGACTLSEKWWPADFVDVATQIAKFLDWLTKQTHSRNWVVVVTHEYAVELCKRLCATPATPPAAGEWRTYRLPADGPNTFVKAESYVLRPVHSETDSEWKARLERYTRVHFGLKDTPFEALWKKAEKEAKEYEKHLRNEAKSRKARAKAYRPTQREIEESLCVYCGADLGTDSVFDTQSYDTCCRKCGFVISHHPLNDKGGDQRNFEGEPDKSHHSVPGPIDALLVSAQLQTTRSKCFVRPGTRRPMGAGRMLLPTNEQMNNMGRESIDTRKDRTTQEKKDDDIRLTLTFYRKLVLDPNILLSRKVHKLVEQVFCFKRKHEVSFQGVGTSKKYRPKDATLTQHQAATWLAAERLVRARESRGPTHTYVPLAIAGAPTWQKKRGYEATVDRDADSATALIPRQAKRRCSNIRPLNERAQALMVARTQRREALAVARKAAALTAAKMALHAAQAATEAAQLQATA
jgi:transcription initiation factor TFIIIB Brf1 subunit/transcription initiation factor TFIIB